VKGVVLIRFPSVAGPLRRLVVSALIGFVFLCATAATAPGAGPESTRQLFQAVHANDLAAVQASIAGGADLAARDRWGMTALELAIDKGYYQIAHMLTTARNVREPTRSSATAAPARPSAPARARVAAQPIRPAARETALPPARPAAPAAPDTLVTESGTPAGQAGPADRHNPFDPSRPPPGVGFPVVKPPAGGDTGADWAKANTPGFALTDIIDSRPAKPRP
jgi:hypothetical protein